MDIVTKLILYFGALMVIKCAVLGLAVAYAWHGLHKIVSGERLPKRTLYGGLAVGFAGGGVFFLSGFPMALVVWALPVMLFAYLSLRAAQDGQ